MSKRVISLTIECPYILDCSNVLLDIPCLCEHKIRTILKRHLSPESSPESHVTDGRRSGSAGVPTKTNPLVGRETRTPGSGVQQSNVPRPRKAEAE